MSKMSNDFNRCDLSTSGGFCLSIKIQLVLRYKVMFVQLGYDSRKYHILYPIIIIYQYDNS